MHTKEVMQPHAALRRVPRLGEGKWGRKKHRRIPKCEGDYQGRVPKRSLHPKTLQNKRFGAPNFFRDLSQFVRRTPRDTPVPLYTRTSPWPTRRFFTLYGEMITKIIR